MQDIPINDAFMIDGKCPLCYIKDQIEEQIISKVLSNDMLISDDFVEDLKKYGFCKEHLKRLLNKNDRLSLGIILNFQFNIEIENIEKNNGLNFRDKILKKELNNDKECYICKYSEDLMPIYLNNIIKMYEEKPDFRSLFDESDGFCINHYNQLINHNRIKKDMKKSLKELEIKVLKNIQSDLKYYLEKFEFKNRDLPWLNSKDSIERTINKFIGDI
ncbi:DUF6062 family protein [Oceanotoga teriensis]|nr:DUF6062 family protein [Oceanotoga teriensis]